MFVPEHTDYYALDPSDPAVEAVFGVPRVERTKLEAAARKIAEALLLRDETNRALLEADLEETHEQGKQTKQGTQGTSLQAYVDTRDAQPPAAHMRSAEVSNHLYWLLGPPAHARERGTSQVLGEVARFIVAHQVVKLSDYHRMVRWLLDLKHIEAAREIMDTLLMARPGGFSTPTYTLCLELALATGDARWFGELAKRVKWKRAHWFALQHKFDAPSFDRKHADVVRLLAQGYAQFNRSKDLTYIMEHSITTPELLLVSMQAAVKWNEPERVAWTLAQLKDADRDTPAGAAVLREAQKAIA